MLLNEKYILTNNSSR